MTGGTLDRIALELAKLLEPLQSRLSAGEIVDLFVELGLEFPPALETQGSFVSALEQTGTAIGQLEPLVEQLVSAIEAEDVERIVAVSTQVVGVVAAVVPALETIATELNSLAGSLPGMEPAAVEAFAADLAVRLLDFSISGYLQDYHPVLLQVLALLGIVDIIHEPGSPTDPTQLPHTKKTLKLERIGDLLSSPDGQLKALYGWGEPSFDGLVFLERLSELLASLSVPVAYDAEATPPTMRILLLRLFPRTDLSPPGLEAELALSLPVGEEFSFPLIVPEWRLAIALKAELAADAGITIQPPAQFNVVPPSGSVQGRASVGVQRLPKAPAPSISLLAIPGGSRLDAAQIGAGLVVDLQWDSTSNQASADFGLEGQIKGGKLVLTMEEADGFLKKLLEGFRVESDFDVGFGWTSGGGVFFTGSSTVEIQLPTHISLGPVDIDAITLSLGLKGQELPIALSANLKAALGPLQAVVEQIGLEADLSFPPDHHGNLGPLDLGFRFKPPKGAGLSIDAGVVVGGGYLFFDPDRGEYAGVLELSLAEIVTVKAIGLITTRMPDGSQGFSLLIIITAEFGAGIQLGFGFTLNGVGGLLGVNRMMLFEPLMQGVRTGSVDSIMFPHDVVANAPRIISDLRAIFPPNEGTFLIGPMAKLGWGEPTLVSLSLGVIIVVPPGDIALLGVLKLALPTEEADILRLQVNFAGALEFSKQRLYFFASLYDSHLLFITIQGEMGLLFAYGQDANFVLSVGGFHPQFNPPPLPFPTPQRIQLNVLNESYARIRCDAYFAVTTNTVQFGAHAEMFFGFSALSAEGQAGLDALIQFSPFHFIVEISTSFSVKVFGAGVFGLGIALTLEGPTPWHAHGTASISILFFSIDVNVDFTWGDARDTTLPPVAVMPVLDEELGKRSNWKAELPSGSNLLVSLRQLEESEADLVLHPVGSLQVSQRAIPLDLHLDKVGSQKPSDANQFSLAVASSGLTKTQNLQEPFAPAQFRDLDDAGKLSAPAYSPFDSGVELAPDGKGADSGAALTRTVRYDLHLVDTTLHPPERFRFQLYPGALFQHWLGGASVAFSDLSRAQAKLTKPYAEAVTVGAETFAVVSTADNTLVHPEAAAFTSKAAAGDYMAAAVAAEPTLAGTLQVLPSFEVAA
ncbi:MAG: DUF6603 domain-containing protein [Solirubrobacterales bacterium]